jgi:hypothetical protein
VKALFVIILVAAALIGGLLVLRSTRGAGMPDRDVIRRAKQREREQAAKDDRE